VSAVRNAALAALLLPQLAAAGPISNGDFETGDFTGWSIDSDGFDGDAPDFQVVGVPGNHQARVEIDYGVTNFGLFANTLFQPIDLTAGPGMELVLSFDWEFDGVDNPDTPDEVFSVGFSNETGGFFGADGQGGTLLDALSYIATGAFTAVLDPADFTWATDWVLEFQINTGGNGFGSYALLDNIALTERPAAFADEPALLLAPGLALLALYRRRQRRAARA
jgi:hypothetical protein